MKEEKPLNLPDDYEVENPYKIPVHDQGDKNNCTSHTFALMMEYHLSEYFKERTLIDVDDLWEKQKRLGTATDRGDFLEGPFFIATKYGVKFKTDSGKTGRLFLSGKKRTEGMITSYMGWKIKLDSSFSNKMFNFFKRKKPQQNMYDKYFLQQEYNQSFYRASISGFQTIQNAPNITIEFSDSGFSEFIKQEFKDIGPIEIQIWDRGIQKTNLQRVSDEYSAALKGGRLGGMGSPVPEAYIDLAKFTIGFLFKWGLDHIINDLDSKIWETLKTRIYSLYNSLKEKLKGEVAIVTSSRVFRYERPTILFILPTNLSKEEFKNCLNFVSSKTLEIIRNFSEFQEAQKNNFYQFKYNKEKCRWEIVEKQTFD